jgi:hypothetical protein
VSQRAGAAGRDQSIQVGNLRCELVVVAAVGLAVGFETAPLIEMEQRAAEFVRSGPRTALARNP